MSSSKIQQRVMAFDYGTQKIGIAIGQTITQTANPLPAIKARDGVPDWTLLASIISEWQPDLFVVGHPLNMDGSDNEITKRARKFANRLQGRFHKPSQLMDERLSTFAAKQLISDIKGGASLADEPVDSIAAALILESWLQNASES